MINRKFLFLLMVPIFVLALVSSSCDGDGSGTTGSTQRGVTIDGALSQVVVAKADTGAKSTFLAFIDDIFKITKIARAQQAILEGISVEAFDPATDPDMTNPLASDTTDANGEFTLEGVPCDTPLKLVFTFEDVSVTIGDGVVAPCPDGAATGVITMTFSINFSNGTGSMDDLDEQIDPSGSQVSCVGGEQQQMIDDEFFVDGGGGPCIIATGNCELGIIASSVKLSNCSSCIESRGSANVQISTTDFECEASEDGIRTVGASTVDVNVISGDMIDMMDGEPVPTDGTMVPTEMQALAQMVADGTIAGSGNGNIVLSATEDGVDLRGNTAVLLQAALRDGTTIPTDGTMVPTDMMDDTPIPSNGDVPIFTQQTDQANITINGGDNGITAVGNSDAEVNAASCSISPGTSSNGNAEIRINCGQ